MAGGVGGPCGATGFSASTVLTVHPPRACWVAAGVPWPRIRAAAESRRLSSFRAQSAAAVTESLARAFGTDPQKPEAKAVLCVHAGTAARLSSAAASATKRLTFDIWWESWVSSLLPRFTPRHRRQAARLLQSHQVRRRPLV